MNQVKLILVLLLTMTTSASAVDVLVWHKKGAGYETLWVTVDGSNVKIAASRKEAVVSDGTRLWAMRIETSVVELFSCKAMESEDKGTKPEGTYVWPAIKAVGLSGQGDHWVVKPWGKEPFYGEVWNKDLHLAGSVGPYVMIEHLNSGYACGAHGYEDSQRFVWHAALKDSSNGASLLRNAEVWSKRQVHSLLEDAQSEDCVSDPDVGRKNIYLDGLALDLASDGAVDLTATFIHPTEAEWQFACTLDHMEVVPPENRSRKVQPSESIRAAMKALKLTGTGGYTHLNLQGRARTEALRAFKSRSLPGVRRTVAKRDARPFIDQGRKLTGEKRHAAAIAAFDTAIRKDSRAARAWSGRGYAKLKLGDLAGATRDFDHALKLDATNDYHAAIWFNLGEIAEKRGKPRQARRAYRKSAALKPSKAASKRLEAIEKRLE